jgi:hypothetical protein
LALLLVTLDEEKKGGFVYSQVTPDMIKAGANAGNPYLYFFRN